ncbi:ankyrin repeat-containing domain protein [Haematococcus lacustris]
MHPRYATNAVLPPFNDWARVGSKVPPSQQDVERAQLQQRKRAELRRARKLKHLLFDAIMQGSAEQVARYMSLPCILERHTPTGATPLILAAALGDPAIMSLLLEAGAEVAAGDRVGATPLIMAAARGHTKVVNMLLDSCHGGASGRLALISQCTLKGETAAMAAAKGGWLDSLQLLLGAGAPLAAMDSRMRDACMLACHHDQLLQRVRELAKTTPGPFLDGPVLQAGVVQHLVRECGYDLARVDQQGRNCLMQAAAAGAEQVVNLLLGLRPGPRLAALDSEGHTALHHACRGGSVKVVQALVAAGAALEGPDTDRGAKLLCLAAGANQAALLQWLLHQGVGCWSLTDCTGISPPLREAALVEALRALDVLLTAGCRLEARDAKGRTVLAVAARRGLIRTVRHLAARGADLLAADLHGRVPRQLAALHGHTSAAQLLTELARNRLIVSEGQLQAKREESERRGIP